MVSTPLGPIVSVGVTVPDLRRVAIRYGEILGIDHWEVSQISGERVGGATSYGRVTDPAFLSAVGRTAGDAAPLNLGPMTIEATPIVFELVQPVSGESPFAEFRAVHRQGISHVTFAINDRDTRDKAVREFGELGVPVAATVTVDGTLERTFLDTRAALGGFFVELRWTADDHEPGADEHLDVSQLYSRPDGVGPLRARRIGHFGVVVDDTMASLRHYHALLGIEKWNVHDWRVEPGLLEDAFYRSNAVEHSYLAAVGTSPEIAFEVIQATSDKSHYHEFKNTVGVGIHHLFLYVTNDEDEWKEIQDWLTSAGVELAMGANMHGGAASFCYYDTAQDLGGYAVEGVVLRDPSGMGNLHPDYIVDFAAPAASL